MEKYFKSLIYVFAFLIILTLVITLFNYIGLITGITLKILKLIIPIISIFIGGIVIGRNSIKKGWLNGLKIGSITILIFLIITLISKSDVNFKTIIYYLILMTVVILGSMIGISKVPVNK